MWEDPIVEEIHKIREEHARQFGFDLKAIYDDFKVREKKGGRKTVSLPIKIHHLNKAGSQAGN